MAVVLQQEPPRLAFSQNPNRVKLYSADYLDVAGAAAVNILSFNSAVVAGTAINLSWASATVRFTAAFAPDGSGKQFITGDGSAAYVQSLIDYFNGNWYIRTDFVLNYLMYAGSPSIAFTSRQVGASYNMATFLGNVSLSRSVSGENTVQKPGFKHPLEVYIIGEGKVYSRPLDLDYPYTGVTTKDLSEILHSFLDYDRPDLTSAWQLCTKSVKNYYLVYGQMYGDVPEYRRVYQTELKTVALGGYSNQALTRISGADHMVNYLLPAPALYKYQRWFETYPVDQLELRTNQPAFLYFMNMLNVVENLSIKLTLLYDNGDSEVIIKPGGMLQPMQKVCIGCGYRQLGLQAYTTDQRKVVGYSVQLVNTGTGEQRTVIKQFSINREYEDYTRYIVFSDSAGNFKVLRCYGNAKSSVDVTSSLAERYETPETPVAGNFSRYDARLVENDELNTGYLVGDQSQDALQELLLARYAYRAIGDDLVPILIQSKKADLESDGQSLKALKIEYRIAYDEKLYTGSTGALMVPRLNQPQQAINDI